MTFWDFAHEYPLISFFAFAWGVAGLVDISRHITSAFKKGDTQ
jgi:hypothetical protein